MSQSYSPSELVRSDVDHSQEASSSTATFMADDYQSQSGEAGPSSGFEPLPSRLPDSFNDKLQRMRVVLPEGEEGKAKDHSRKGVFQRRVFETYTIPVQGLVTGRRFLVRVSFPAVMNEDWSQVEVLKQVGGGASDHDNPFGRFADVDTIIVLDEERYSDDACVDLTSRIRKSATADLIVTRDAGVPRAKNLVEHHRNGILGFAVFTRPSPDAPPIDLDRVLDAARKLTVALESEERDDFGSITGALDASTIRRWKGSDRERSQGTVMGQEAPAVAASLGLGTDFEWLHLAAHRFGGLSDKPQVASNLVLGTATANTFMMEWEEVISRLAERDDVELVGLDATPELIDPGLPWLAQSIEYTVTVYLDGEAFFMDQVFFPLDRRPPPLAGYITAKELAKRTKLPEPWSS